jgi:hypothetical protein
MSDFIKAERVVATALGLLLREVVLPNLVWRDAGGDFRGVKGDAITIRLPAYAPARKRALRSGAARTKDSLHERSVVVTLDDDIYKDVPISDEEMTLDILRFGEQVLNPIITGIGLELENGLATLISGATYQSTINYSAAGDPDLPYDVLVDAGEKLDNAHAPAGGRVVVLGSGVKSDFLKSPKLSDVDRSGTSAALRDAEVGGLAGFDRIFKSNAIPANEAYAYHRTAYVMSQRAPVVPNGAPWGATQSFQGMAIRTVQIMDPDTVENRFIADSWVGYNTVLDHGHFDADPALGGKFVPVEDPDTPITGQPNAWENDLERLVRAVKITRS